MKIFNQYSTQTKSKTIENLTLSALTI